MITPVQAAPASFTDSGSTLIIDLGAGEQLTIVSNGTSYVFQTNQTFADGGVTDPDNDFSAFGGTSITLAASGLARYDTISITDSGAGASVIFADSGGSTYSDSFNITLDNGSSAATVNGGVSLASGSLAVWANTITLNANVTTANGDVVLGGDEMSIGAAINAGSGIVTLRPETAGQLIDLGGADTAGTLGLTDAEIDLVTAGILRIGGLDAGSITFTGAISPAGTDTLSLITGNMVVDANNVQSDIQVSNLALRTANGVADSGNVILDTEVGTIAALNTTSGGISVVEASNGGSLIVGTVDGVVGMRNEAYTGYSPLLSIQLETNNGDLTVNNDIFNQRRTIYLVAQEGNGGNGDSLFTNNANISAADAKDQIIIVANNMALAGGTITAPNQVTLEDDPSSSATVAINLGGADGVNTLGLTDAELDTVSTTGVLQIGQSGTGIIEVTTPINLTDGPSIPITDLISGAAIAGSGGNVLTANTLNVTAGTGIGSNGDPFAINATGLTTSGSGDQVLSETDSVTIGDNGLNAGAGNTIQLAGGTFLTTSSGGTIANDTSVLNGATLAGTGVVNGSVTVQSGGAVAPGNSPGLLNTGSISFSAGSNFNLEVNGVTSAGTDYDQLNVTGSVNIDPVANLVVSGTITGTPPGAGFVIINNDGADAVTGNFAGLPNGAAVSVNGQDFLIFYNGGDGNDVSLVENIYAPVLSSFTRQDPATSPTNADSLIFRATFSEAVQNVDAADFTVSGTTTATVTAVSPVSTSVYDVTISGGDLAGFTGQVGLNLSGAQNIEDLIGNALPAGEPATDETYTVDNTAPTVTIDQAMTQVDPTNTASIDFTATFDEAAANFTAADVTLGGTAPGTLSAVLSGGPTVYTITVTGMTGTGTVTASLAGGVATDLAGNDNTASTSTDNEVTFDPVAPQAGSLIANDIVTSGGISYTFTLVYSDNLAIDASSVDGNDIRVTGPGGFDQLATLVNVTPGTNGTPRTAAYQITPEGGSWDFTDDGTYAVVLQDSQVRDTAGNFVAGGTLGTFDVAIGSHIFLPLIYKGP